MILKKVAGNTCWQSVICEKLRDVSFFIVYLSIFLVTLFFEVLLIFEAWDIGVFDILDDSGKLCGIWFILF